MSQGTDVLTIKLKYKLDASIDLDKLLGSTSCYLSNEQELSLNHAIQELYVEYEIDRAWGFMRPISLNGHRIQ